MLRAFRGLVRENPEIFPLCFFLGGTMIGAGLVSVFHFAPQLQWSCRDMSQDTYKKLNDYI